MNLRHALINALSDSGRDYVRDHDLTLDALATAQHEADLLALVYRASDGLYSVVAFRGSGEVDDRSPWGAQADALAEFTTRATAL